MNKDGTLFTFVNNNSSSKVIGFINWSFGPLNRLMSHFFYVGLDYD